MFLRSLQLFNMLVQELSNQLETQDVRKMTSSLLSILVIQLGNSNMRLTIIFLFFFLSFDHIKTKNAHTQEIDISKTIITLLSFAGDSIVLRKTEWVQKKYQHGGNTLTARRFDESFPHWKQKFFFF